jgi:DNA modification methylase
MTTLFRYYDLTLDEIIEKVDKQQKRNKKRINQASLIPLDNVKRITNDFGENITRVDGEIPVDLKISNNDRFLFISYDQSKFTHGFHRYPAKFFPELPRWIIKRYSKPGDLILDPFTGSGTANIEALLNRRNSVGIDIEPFAQFVAHVKTTPINNEELIEYNEELVRTIINFHPEKISKEQLPTFPYVNNWFMKEIILELAYIKKSILELDCSTELKNFYLCCFSSIIRGVSNADDNCTRTVIRKKLNKQVYPSDALRRFVETLLLWTPKIIDFSSAIPEHYYIELQSKMDARKIEYGNNTFDLALTSPPYANAVDYPRTHQLESYWLGLVEGSLTPLKKLHVGTESVTIDQYKELHKIGIDSIDAVLQSIYNIDKRRAYICYKYLDDMRKNIIEVNRVLKPGARYIIVVGNNKIRGHVFENWKYLMEIAKDNNFEIENYFGSEIIKHFIKVPREERINTDWIVVLRKR